MAKDKIDVYYKPKILKNKLGGYNWKVTFYDDKKRELFTSKSPYSNLYKKDVVDNLNYELKTYEKDNNLNLKRYKK